MTIGEREKSQFSGFDKLSIILSRQGQPTKVEFLISGDNKVLARLHQIDLTKDPASLITITGRPVRGSPDAPVTVISFDDLECPFCARLHQELFPRTLERYHGLVRVIYKDFPLVEIHPWAMHAAIDANCLAEQNPDAYWQYIDEVHARAQEITGGIRELSRSVTMLDSMAGDSGAFFKLDREVLDGCLRRQDSTHVQASMKEAEALHLEGTPLVIVNGERVNGGAVSSEQLWLVIDRAVRAVGLEAPPIGHSQS